MSTHIFFTVINDLGEPEPYVVADIFSENGRHLASHRMTIAGADIRMHDMAAAITEAKRIARQRAVLYRIHTSDGHEFGTDYTLAQARRLKAEYAKEFPGIRYSIRKAPR